MNWPQRNEPDPRAVALYRRGQAILQTGDSATRGEAIKLYKQAVAIDPRHASLLERTGLEDYWRKSGTLPDFWRGR